MYIEVAPGSASTPRARWAARIIPATWALASALCASNGGAAPAGAAEPDGDAEAARQTAAFRQLSAPPRGYVRLLGALQIGDGLRFNNPYRLATQLGSTAESVSRTSSYVDLAVTAAFGPPDGFQHGASIHFSIALEGVGQQVVTPSYFLGYRGTGRLLGYGRLGTPFILSPDAGMGFELAFGLAWFFTGKLAVSGELVGDLFYGAGTREHGITTYPVLSAQLGILVDQEILP